MNKVTTVAVDLGKKTFQIGFADQYGREAGKQERLTSREAFSEFVANADPRWTVLMEVGWGAQTHVGQLRCPTCGRVARRAAELPALRH